MVCLDSDVLINFLRNDPNTVKLIQNLRSKGNKLSITSINSFELLKGIPSYSNFEKINIIKFLNNFNIYNFELNSSKKAAEIFENLKTKGEMIDLADIMIASIVITKNERLITNNLKHFEKIKDLIIEEF
ncbi:MAG: PIN domain-containing protein [Nanoarchaeota archaeon]